MAHYKLISFKICPYVQRAAIVLNAKGIDYDIEYIDLKNKPGWFKELSPLGQVPVLVLDDETVLFESQVIAEYLDEVEEPRLHPADPLRRAQHRAYIEVISSIIPLAWRWGLEGDPELAKGLSGQVAERLGRICSEQKAGDFFEGAAFSLVDAAMAPVLQRCGWVEQVKPAGIFDGLDIARWQAALLERDEVKNSHASDLEDIYRALIKPLDA